MHFRSHQNPKVNKRQLTRFTIEPSRNPSNFSRLDPQPNQLRLVKVKVNLKPSTHIKTPQNFHIMPTHIFSKLHI
uniref:Uncharacterized protein n=1 Tax=Helianthus annuus TaxID=4232 RepID=A0A251UG39_HELAN